MAKTTEEVKDLATKDQTNDLAIFNGLEGYDDGFSELKATDISQPFLVIRHKPLTAPNDKKVILCPQGNFSNSLTGRDLGETLDMVVLKIEKRYVEWEPDGGDFVGKYTEEEANNLGKFDHQDTTGVKWFTAEGNSLVLTYYYYVVLPGHTEEGMLVWSLKSTGIKHARKINNMIPNTTNSQGQRLPAFANIWRATSAQNINDKGQESYTIGEGKKTYFEHVTRIDEDILKNLVLPSLEILKTLDTTTIVGGRAEDERDDAEGEDAFA